LPRREPDLVGVGDEREAQSYVLTEGTTWTATPGAVAWLRRAPAEEERDAAAADAPDPRRTGPAFFLNPYDELGFSRCPECDEKTKVRQRSLAVLVEPGLLLVENARCRVCEADDLLIAKQAELEVAMAAHLETFQPDAIGADYFVVGLLERDDLRRMPGEGLEPEWALEHVKGVREHYELDDDPLDSPLFPLLGEAEGDEAEHALVMADRPRLRPRT